MVPGSNLALHLQNEPGFSLPQSRIATFKEGKKNPKQVFSLVVVCYLSKMQFLPYVFSLPSLKIKINIRFSFFPLPQLTPICTLTVFFWKGVVVVLVYGEILKSWGINDTIQPTNIFKGPCSFF